MAGLLPIGLVADDDGLFAAVGHLLARTAPSATLLFFGATVMFGVVTALKPGHVRRLPHPVLMHAVRSRGEGEAPLFYGCMLFWSLLSVRYSVFKSLVNG